MEKGNTLRLNTNTKKLTHKEIRKIVEKTIKYCVENLGTNKRRGKCGLVVRNQNPNEQERRYGEYCPETHTIRVFKNNCDNIKDLIITTLHEYTHNLQPIKSKYFKMLKVHGYDNHPMEIEAVENEKLCLDVWKNIKK
jgi:hypothetical protein